MKILNLEQGSMEWLKFKAGKVSGTSLKSAVGTPAVKETLIKRLIAERMTETVNDDLNTEAVLRGKELEPVALRAVIKETGISFETVGMIAPINLENYAVSPDAIYCEPNPLTGGIDVIGGLEIKCPNSKKHIEYLRKGVVPKEYLHQVIAPFLCDESVKWWDFASFDDRNYERPLFIVRTYRTDIQDKITLFREELIKFLARVDEEYYNLTF